MTQTTLNYYAKRKLLPIHQQAFYNSLILNLIIKDLQPFSIVEDEGFKELIAGFDSSYKLPSRTTLSRTLLPEKYNLVSEKIKLILQDATDITLTTDTWTSMATESYMSITAHFIDENWEMHSILVDCFKFGERHTSENLKMEIIRVLTEWEILDKVQTIVTDNAYNITNAIKLTEWNHLPCLAHTINLIVQSALKKIENLQTKVKKTVEYFHRSTMAAEKLRSFQAQMNESSNTLKLINDVQTRWNSTYDMFQRISTLQEPVEAALGVLHNPIEPISVEEWGILREICTVLKPFKEITVELSAEKVVTSSKIIPMIQGLKTYLRKDAALESPIANDLKNALLDGIKTRFPRFEYNRILAHSTLLDPRFGKNAFSDPSALEKIKSLISNKISGLIKSDQTTNANIPSPDSNESSIWQDFDRKVLSATAMTTPLSDSIIELRRYSEEPIIKRHENALQWWKSRSSIYPRLGRLAKRYLSVVATSVPSERVFSKTGLIVSEKRSRLKAENVQKIVFLNGNQSFLK